MATSATHTFDRPLDEVWAMFGTIDAHVAKFEGMGHREIGTVRADPGAARQRIGAPARRQFLFQPILGRKRRHLVEPRLDGTVET